MSDDEALTITEADAGNRLDQFLPAKFPDHTRSYFNKIIKEGLVLVNGKEAKSGYILRMDDRIGISFPDVKSHLLPVDIALNIVYEDEDILVINKPAGMIVHPGHGTAEDTLVHALLYHTGELAESAFNDRPGIVHRLDKDTSGLLVTAKNDYAHLELRRQFESKSIHRIYWALVWGKLRDTQGTVKSYLDRSRRDPTKMAVTAKGREAITHYTVLKHFEFMTLLEIRLDTGRTHQIRVHMNHIHHPVVGDADYNGRESQLNRFPSNLKKRGQNILTLMQRQALHAKKLSFVHPRTGAQLDFECELHEDFDNLLRKLPDILLLSAGAG